MPLSSLLFFIFTCRHPHCCTVSACNCSQVIFFSACRHLHRLHCPCLPLSSPSGSLCLFTCTHPPLLHSSALHCLALSSLPVNCSSCHYPHFLVLHLCLPPSSLLAWFILLIFALPVLNFCLLRSSLFVQFWLALSSLTVNGSACHYLHFLFFISACCHPHCLHSSSCSPPSFLPVLNFLMLPSSPSAQFCLLNSILTSCSRVCLPVSSLPVQTVLPSALPCRFYSSSSSASYRSPPVAQCYLTYTIV